MDHEIYNGTDTVRFNILRGDDGNALYSIQNIVPQYRDPLTYTQRDWSGGHGQYNFGRLDRYYEGQSIDTTQEGKLFLGPLIHEIKESDASDLDGPPVGFKWFKATGEWLCWTATNIYRYDVGSDNEWTVATTGVTGVLQLTEFATIMYAARGATGAYMYSADGDTWTATDLTDTTAYGFLVAPNPDGTAENLWKFKTANELSRTTDGRTVAGGGVNWETPTYVGDTSHNITNIFLLNNRLMVGKADNLYHVDSNGGVHPFRPDLRIGQSTNNYKYVAEWQTSVYHSEARGMAEITAYNSYDVMGPLAGIDDIGKIGDIKGIAGDKDWLYVAVDEGTNTIIYKGTEKLGGDNNLRWHWCPWVFLGTKTCTAIAVCQHSTTDLRLWFGYTNTTGYVILSDNPTADSAARFATSGFLRMSYDYGTDPEWDELYQSAVVEQTRYNSGAPTGASAGETVQIKYRDDTDTTATAVIAAYTTAGLVETNFAAGGVAGTPITNKRVQFEIHLASDTSTATPVVTYFQAKGIEKPVRTRIHEAIYSLGDSPRTRAKTLRDFFRTARTTTTLLKFADLRFGEKANGTAGTDYVYCVLEPGSPEQVEVSIGRDRKTLGIKVRLREVNYS